MTTQERVKAHIEKKGWSQQEFADAAGIGQVSVSRILRGESVGPGIAIKLARYFGLQPETLMK